MSICDEAGVTLCNSSQMTSVLSGSDLPVERSPHKQQPVESPNELMRGATIRHVWLINRMIYLRTKPYFTSMCVCVCFPALFPNTSCSLNVCALTFIGFVCLVLAGVGKSNLMIWELYDPCFVECSHTPMSLMWHWYTVEQGVI